METLRHAEHSLRRTVDVMCDLLTVQTPRRHNGLADEARLRHELVSCILTSQVSALSAERALERIEGAGLLDNARWKANDPEFEIEIANALRFSCDGCGAYRFPQSKAAQLSKLRSALQHSAIRSTLTRERDARCARRKLVALPGVGPKQASMFLRNIGFSYALAILDVHVLRFLYGIGVLRTPQPRVATLAQYEQVETLAIEYADTCGREVGYLDWAIWITMKAMRELQK